MCPQIWVIKQNLNRGPGPNPEFNPFPDTFFPGQINDSDGDEKTIRFVKS
jgi:hypothetical protein